MYHSTVRLFQEAAETFAYIVIDKSLRIHSMTERGLEEHELKAFGLFRQAKDPEWPPDPKMQKGKASGQDSLEPSEGFITSPANPHQVKSNFSPIRSFLEATKSPSMGSCSSRIAPELKVSCQVSTHRRGRARVITFGGLSV